MGKDLIQERQGCPRNDVLHIMASLYHCRGLIQRNAVYPHLLRWDMYIYCYTAYKEDLCLEAYWSTAYNHRALLPLDRYGWVPSQPKCTEQTS